MSRSDSIELEQALALLSLPRQVGTHPEDGEPIVAGIGRYGPYVQHGKTYANLETGEDVLTIGLNRAVALIADKAANPRRRGGAGAPGRSLGEHPAKGGDIQVKAGRYGPYVTHDGVNATLPNDIAPEAITLDQAVVMLDARAARGASTKGRRPAKKAGRPSTDAKSKTSAKSTVGAKAKVCRQGAEQSRRQKSRAARKAGAAAKKSAAAKKPAAKTAKSALG